MDSLGACSRRHVNGVIDSRVGIDHDRFSAPEPAGCPRKIVKEVGNPPARLRRKP